MMRYSKKVRIAYSPSMVREDVKMIKAGYGEVLKGEGIIGVGDEARGDKNE